MADVGDDMNATPLAKLPPPVLQSKVGQMPVEAPNYRDLLTDMDQSAHRGPIQPQSAAMLTMPPPPPQSVMEAPLSPSMYAPQSPPPLSYPTHPAWPSPAYHHHHPASPPPPPLHPPRKSSVAWRLLRANKAALFVVVLMFLALVVAVPRLVRVPRFATLEGRLNVLGALAVSVTAGGMFKLATAVT